MFIIEFKRENKSLSGEFEKGDVILSFKYGGGVSTSLHTNHHHHHWHPTLVLDHQTPNPHTLFLALFQAQHQHPYNPL